MKKVLWISAIVLALFVVGAQFFGLAKSNPPSDSAQSAFVALEIPPPVMATLKRACGDCHSNDTRWPWYTYVAPVSWWTIGHVNEARSHLNFSEWGKLPPDEAVFMLGEICGQVEGGAMPLPSYLRMHAEARLTLEDRKNICLWTIEQRNKLAGKSAGHEEQR